MVSFVQLVEAVSPTVNNVVLMVLLARFAIMDLQHLDVILVYLAIMPQIVILVSVDTIRWE
jgi:hypothetical protein